MLVQCAAAPAKISLMATVSAPPVTARKDMGPPDRQRCGLYPALGGRTMNSWSDNLAVLIATIAPCYRLPQSSAAPWFWRYRTQVGNT